MNTNVRTRHCPHLGGAALGTLVLLANEQALSRRALLANIDATRAHGDRLFAENQRLQAKLNQVKLNQVKLNQVKLNQVKLNQVKLNQVKLNQVKLNQVKLNQVKLELKLERQNKFATNKQKTKPSPLSIFRKTSSTAVIGSFGIAMRQPVARIAASWCRRLETKKSSTAASGCICGAGPSAYGM